MMTKAAPAWALIGVLALLGNAIARLTPRAVEALTSAELAGLQIAFAVGWTAWMLYAEGYRGFQGSFAPRVAARAMHLGRSERTWYELLLAPAYAMGLFAARRRTMIVAWVVLLLVITLVILVSQLAQPWRGLVDLGVVAGLAYGAGAVVWFALRAARDPEGMARWLALPD